MPDNEFTIGTNEYLDQHFKPIFIGREEAPFQLSTETFKVKGDFYLEGKFTSLSDIFDNIDQYDDAVRNNAGGVYNHNLYFNLLKLTINRLDLLPFLE